MLSPHDKETQLQPQAQNQKQSCHFFRFSLSPKVIFFIISQKLQQSLYGSQVNQWDLTFFAQCEEGGWFFVDENITSIVAEKYGAGREYSAGYKNDLGQKFLSELQDKQSKQVADEVIATAVFFKSEAQNSKDIKLVGKNGDYLQLARLYIYNRSKVQDDEKYKDKTLAKEEANKKIFDDITGGILECMTNRAKRLKSKPVDMDQKTFDELKVLGFTFFAYCVWWSLSLSLVCS